MSGPLLVFGADGQVGREIMDRAAGHGHAVAGFNRAAVDILDMSSVAQAIGSEQPRLVVNAAAYTAVDKAEAEPDAARIVNVVGAENVARAAQRANVPVIHFSTDYVFDGSKSGAYVESDPIAPLGVYGRTKADGEERVRSSTAAHIIIRTSWVYGPHGSNFLKTILRLAGERDELRIVCDQRGCPTATADIAEAVLAVDRVVSLGERPWGTYHLAGQGVTSWFEFATAIVEAQAQFTKRRPFVRPIRSVDWPSPARRPQNSELDSSLFAATFGYRAAPWQARVTETVAHLLER